MGLSLIRTSQQLGQICVLVVLTFRFVNMQLVLSGDMVGGYQPKRRWCELAVPNQQTLKIRLMRPGYT